MLKKFHEAALDEIYVPGSNEEVFSGRLLKVQRDHVTLPNGNDTTREYIRHPGAVAIVPVLADGSVVLVKQCRYPLGTLLWEIPAGKLDHGPEEDTLECAKRELSEETGLTADHWRKLTVLETTPGFCNERIHLYLATGLHAGKTHPDEDEFVCTLRMPLSDAVQKVMDGTFRDGKTALALLMVQQLLSAPCQQ